MKLLYAVASWVLLLGQDLRFGGHALSREALELQLAVGKYLFLGFLLVGIVLVVLQRRQIVRLKRNQDYILSDCQEELRRVNNLFKTLFDFSHESYLLLNQRQILSCNPAARKFFGLKTKDSALNQSPKKFFCQLAQSKAKAEHKFGSIFSRGTTRFECRLRTAKKRFAPVEVHSIPIEYHKKELWLMLIRDLSEKKAAEAEIKEHRRLLNEKNRHLTKGINSARRIQNALLTDIDQIQAVFPDSFIFFRPREEVSGDFYWFKKIQKNNADLCIITVADCTGHGIPGAFVSMLGVAFLNEIVGRREMTSPNKILESLREQVKTSLHQTHWEADHNDGIDMALCVIDKNKMTLQFAGANNPAVIIRSKPKAESEIFVFEPDYVPIGIYPIEPPFTNKHFELKKGDVLYLFSDGYADQFGGKEGKKFMSKNFRHLLEEIHTKEMAQQKQILQQRLDQWIEDWNKEEVKNEQVDDILVAGIRF